MSVPLHIQFLNIPPSEAVEADIRRRAEKLAQISDRITRCNVAIETSGKHKQQGHEYEVRIDLVANGSEIVINRVPANEDLYVAVRDAFDAAVRKLNEHLRVVRGD